MVKQLLCLLRLLLLSMLSYSYLVGEATYLIREAAVGSATPLAHVAVTTVIP